MTVEEIEILVTARVEEALKDIPKLVPVIKKAVQQAQEAFKNMNTDTFRQKLHQAVQFAKKKIADLKKSTENNEIAIKVNNKEAKKQVTQLEKEIDSLQKKISASQMKLNLITPKLDKITTKTIEEVTPKGISSNNPAIQNMVNNSLANNKEYSRLSMQEEKLVQQIEEYSRQLDVAKSKMSQLAQETSQTATSQNRLTSFFSGFRGKLEQAKTSVGSLKGQFNQIPKITQNITNNIKKMGTNIKSGLGHILKYAAALFSIRGIYSILSQSAQSWLSSQNSAAQQLSANIEYMKYAMGSAFAPVIEYVINLVYQLMKAIQSVVFAFTGINIFAKATASSMNNVAGSAKKANKEAKSLAGIHNEINNVQSQDNSNSGGSGAVGPSIDLSQVDTSMNTWIDRIKEKLKLLFEPIKKSWDIYGQPLIDSMHYAFSSSLGLIKTIGRSFEEVWTNGTGEHTVSTILQTLTSIFNIIGNIRTAFKEAWENSGGTEIVQQLWNGFNNLLDIIGSAFKVFEEWTKSESFQVFANSIVGIINTLSGWFEKLTIKLKEIWENGGKQTFEKLLEFISKVVEAIDVVLQTLTPVIDFILDMVTPVIEGIISAIGFVIDALSGILDFIIGIFTGDWDRAWSGIGEFFEGIWNTIKTLIDTVLKFIANLWNTIWNSLKNTVTIIWNAIKTLISNVINGIKNTISNVLNTIKTVWNNIWNGIKTTITNIWNGIWNTIKSVVNKILGGIESFVNGIVRGINKVLSGISKVANAVGSLIGLNPINLQLSTISLPRLKKGNVAYSETLAVFGEYTGANQNPEITAPQSIMYDTMRKAIEDTDFYSNNNGQPINIIVMVGNKKLGEIMIEDLRDKTRRTGKDIEALIGG